MKYLILVLVMLLYINQAFAQQDTIKKPYYQGESPNAKLKAKYDYFTRAKIEELSMFKAGVYISSFGLIAPYIGYEKKLSQDISVLVNLGYGVATSFRRGTLPLAADLTIGSRFYYNMPQRIWEGKSANNLSGNYLSLQISNFSAISQNKEFIYMPYLEALYGIQRRLGPKFFFDLNGGVACGFRFSGDAFPIGFVINANLGFGL